MIRCLSISTAFTYNALTHDDVSLADIALLHLSTNVTRWYLCLNTLVAFKLVSYSEPFAVVSILKAGMLM